MDYAFTILPPDHVPNVIQHVCRKRGLVIHHNLCIRLRGEKTTALFLWLNTEVLLMQIYAILINFANLCQQMLQNVDSVLTQKCVTT